jgi:hypothetical protein
MDTAGAEWWHYLELFGYQTTTITTTKSTLGNQPLVKIAPWGKGR